MKSILLKKTAVVLSLLLVWCSLPGCAEQERQRTFYGCFDTVTTVVAYDSGKNFDAACGIIEEELHYWHRLSDIYHEYSGINNACTVNRRASEEAVTVPKDLFSLLAFGKTVYVTTAGQCNIAMGAVLKLWHEAREEALQGGEATVPALSLLQAAAEHCGIDDLVLDPENMTVKFTDAGLSLDLGAVAKGYAAERIAEKLTAAGFTGYALSLGGNVRVIGTKPRGAKWVSGIENPDPDSPDAYVEKIELQDQALVTSGSYQRYFEADGIRYHHIISPESLYPENTYLSVTVRCPSSDMADALSTALFNCSVEEGKAIISDLEETDVWWILADGSIVRSGE